MNEQYPLAPTPVKLKEERKEKLKAFLDEKITMEFDQRSTSGWKKAIDQYNCKMIPPAQDSYEVQVDTSLSRDRAQQFMAYLLNPIFSQDQIFVAVPRWGTDKEMADAMNALSDYVSDRVQDQQFAYDWLEQALILPASPYVVLWEHKRYKVKRWEVVEEPVTDPDGNPVTYYDPYLGELVPQTEKKYKEIEREELSPPRARPVTIPLADFAMEGENPDDAQYILWRAWLTKEELRRAANLGNYGKEVLGLLDKIDEVEKEGVRLETSDDNIPESVKRGKYFEVFECYLRFDVDGDGEEEEIVATYLRSAGLLLRCVYNWWHRFKRPFGTFCYKPLPGTWWGQSLMSICEPYHRIHGGQLRLRLGSAVNAVEPLIIDRSGTLREYVRNGRLRRGYVHARGVGNIREDVEIFWLGQSIPAEAALQNLGREIAESLDSLVGITPYLRGIESIQRPTATGQMALIEAGKQTLYLAMDRFSRELARMHNIRINMYRQCFPAGLEIFMRHSDQATQQMMSQFVAWPPDDFIIETKVSSATMNLNLKKQETLALLDKFPDVMNNIAKLAQDATAPGPFAPIARELLRSYIETVKMWLLDFRANEDVLMPKIDQALEEADVLATILQENEQLRSALGVSSGGGGDAAGGGTPGASPIGGGTGAPALDSLPAGPAGPPNAGGAPVPPPGNFGI